MRQVVSHKTIVEALQNSAHTFGVEPLSERINKARSTLYAELNPYQYVERREDEKPPQHKLGLQDAMLIMETTGDFKALHLMCASFGFAMRPVGAEPVVAVVAFQTFAQVVHEVGGLAEALQYSLADGRLTKDERVEIARQARVITDALAPFLAIG